jgi:hypothetical protein
MALASNALCTVEEVKQYLKKSRDGSNPLIEMTINAVSDFIEEYCNRIFAAAAYTEYHNGRGLDYIPVRNPPINSVTSIHDDPDRDYTAAYLVDSDDYVIDASEMFIQADGITFSKGWKNIKIVYNGGYAAIPENLKYCAVAMAVLWYKQADRDQLGIYAKSNPDGGSLTFSRPDLLPMHRRILLQYRIRAF